MFGKKKRRKSITFGPSTLSEGLLSRIISRDSSSNFSMDLHLQNDTVKDITWLTKTEARNGLATR